VKCVQCGAEVPEGMRFCGMCGGHTSPPVVTPGEPKNRFCVSCGRAVAWDANACQYCGHDYRKVARDTGKDQLVAGAVLTIMAGVLSIVLTSIVLMSAGNLGPEGVAMMLLVYGCAVMGVIGGMVALAKRAFPIAVLGAACSIMGLAFFFGIPGLILIVKSSAQFGPS
jgi:hypothetical protein